jgi:hypothetical protein
MYVRSCREAVPASSPAPAPAPSSAPTSASKWTAVKDPDSGDTYYYNTATGETTWDKPEGVDAGVPSPAAAQTPAAPQSPQKPVVASGWKAVFDAESNSYYYHNAATGETTWDKPEGFVDTPTSPGEAKSSPPASRPITPAPASAHAHSATKTLSDPSKALWTAVLARAKADAASEGGPAGFEGLRAFAESMKQKREKRAAATTPGEGGVSGGAGGGSDPASSTSAASSTTGRCVMCDRRACELTSLSHRDDCVVGV